MAQRVRWFKVKITIHPLFLPILLGLVFYGNVSFYAIIISSLLLHELGHLLVAILLKVPIKSCVIMPYGGEIELGTNSIHPFKEFCIALGGPIATFLCFLVAKFYFIHSLWAPPFIKVQLIILAVNLIPILPLDGGRIVYSLLIILYRKAKIIEGYLLFSLLFNVILLFIGFVFLPQSIFLLIIATFLLLQIIKEWRFRKYRIAFEKLVLKRLT